MQSRTTKTIAAACVALAMAGGWGGCAEMQISTGNERLDKMIHGGGTLLSGLLPIGYEEEQSIGAAIALQVVARYGGVYDQPELTRYVNLVGRAVALTCDRPAIPYHFSVLNSDSIHAFAAPAGYVFVACGEVVGNGWPVAGEGHGPAHQNDLESR